jgi:nitrous oxidase accessory protein
MKLIRCLLLFLLLHFTSHAATLRVKEGQNISATVQKAQSRDTIIIENGLFREANIVVDKPLFITGNGKTVLDGQFKYEVITVKSSDVTIRNLKIVRSGKSSVQDLAGIRILNTRRVKILNNTFEDTFFGIYSQYGTACTISGNTLIAHAKLEQQSGNGIHCWKSDSLLIQGNSIQGHRDGIYFEFVTNSKIIGNTSRKNLRYGLHFMFSNDDIYTSNVFSDNGAGVAVMFSKKVEMYNNKFINNWGDAAYGILLKEISDGIIRGNTFSNNTSGIYMEGANRILAERNIFDSNGWGLKIQSSCMDITVRENNFTGNTFDIATNGTLQLNTFEGNYWDKYEGYDLNKDKTGDIPYHPVSMFSMIIEKYPAAMILFRSFITNLLDRTEKVIPSIIPENLVDKSPRMNPVI